MSESNVTTGFAFLSDLIDDLSLEQLSRLLNWLSVNRLEATRANIKGWRKDNNLAVNQ